MRREKSSPAPPRRPPPGLPYYGTAPRPSPHRDMASTTPMWLPHGSAMTAPFPPPRPMFPRLPPPPPPLSRSWAIPLRPTGFPTRPPPQPAMLLRPPPPPPPLPPRSGRQMRPNMRPPPVDPEQLWLAEFSRKHLEAERTASEPTINDQEPPLRQIRARLAQMLAMLDELDGRAHELLELEEKISKAAARGDELAVARLKAQAERARKDCEQFRRTLDELQDPKPFGIGGEMYWDALSFSKCVQKKKAYRQRRREQLRAENTIREQLHVQEPPNRNEESAPNDDGATAGVLEPNRTGSNGTDSSTCARRDRQRECEAARRVLLALELWESRQGNTLTHGERQEIDQARKSANSSLRRKRKRKRRRILVSDEAQNSHQTPAKSALRERDQSVAMPLREPYAVDMETLIAVRRKWDVFIVPKHINGASAIPPHFVIPPVNPAAQWSFFVTRSNGSEQDT